MVSTFLNDAMLLAYNGRFECITDLFLTALEGFLGHHWCARPRAWCTLCGFGYYRGRFQEYETALLFPCVYISLPLQVRNGLWFRIESGGKTTTKPTNHQLFHLLLVSAFAFLDSQSLFWNSFFFFLFPFHMGQGRAGV